MEFVHPVADEWTDEYAVFVASSRRVLLTEPLAGFLDYTKNEGLKPILVTAPEARLSPFLSFAMMQAGGHWVIQAPSGAFDAMSGYRIRSFPDLWNDVSTTRERWRTFTEWSATAQGALLFDVFAHQRANADTRIGHLGAALVQTLGGREPDVWGLAEPLTEAWDVDVVTETARRGMPHSDVMHAGASDGSFCDVSVDRTKRGLLEHAKGGVLIDAYPTDVTEVMARATAALTMTVERFQPTVGFVSLAESDGPWQGAYAQRPEVPLAVVIGPRGVHDLKIDVDELARWHDVTLLGRRRTPSLLVRFSKRHTGLWTQLMAFSYDLGLERIQVAAGLTED